MKLYKQERVKAVLGGLNMPISQTFYEIGKYSCSPSPNQCPLPKQRSIAPRLWGLQCTLEIAPLPFLRGTRSAKQPREKQIPKLYHTVCSSHFTQLFHQIYVTKEWGTWALGPAGALGMQDHEFGN